VATFYDNFELSYSQNDFDLLTSIVTLNFVRGRSKSNRLLPGLCPTIS